MVPLPLITEKTASRVLPLLPAAGGKTLWKIREPQTTWLQLPTASTQYRSLLGRSARRAMHWCGVGK